MSEATVAAKWRRRGAETRQVDQGPNGSLFHELIYNLHWQRQRNVGPTLRYKYNVQCRQYTVVLSRYFLWSEVQGTGDTLWNTKYIYSVGSNTVVLSRYYCACVTLNTGVWTEIETDTIFTHDRSDSPSLHTLICILRNNILSDPA